MDPSATIIALWNSESAPATLSVVAEWAGVTGSLQAALWSGLGADPQEHYRALAALSEEEVIEIIDVTPFPHNGCRPPKRRRV